MDCASNPGVIAARTEPRRRRAASFARRGMGGADRSHRAVPYLRRQVRSLGRHALAAALALAALVTLTLGAPGEAQAQTTVTLVSNAGQGSTGSITSSQDRSQAFTTGAAGATLSSVEIITRRRSETVENWSTGWPATFAYSPHSGCSPAINRL